MRLEDGMVTVRELVPEDASVLLKWLTDSEVLAFYEGRDAHFTLEKIQKVFFDGENTRFIIEWQGKPAGYVQFYSVEGDGRTEYQFDGPEQRVFGMDQFLGEPGLWGKGIGRKFIRLILKHLFEDCGAEAVVLDPHADNLRAIRCYEACGFRKEKFLPAHELHEGKMRDCWLMVCRDSPNDRKADTQ